MQLRAPRLCPVLVLVVSVWAAQEATGSSDFTVVSEYARKLSEHAAEAESHSTETSHAGGGEHEAPHGGHEEAGAEEHGGGHEAAGGHGDAHATGGHGGHATGGKSGHMAHHTHHHLKSSVMGTTTAVMLMGFVAFMMALFYLVNWYDEDIRLYTWVISSVTVSIFIAVLLFSAFSECVSAVLWESFYREFLQFVALWFITQFFMYHFKDAATGEKTPHGKEGDEKKPLTLAPHSYAPLSAPASKEGMEVEKGEKEPEPIPNVPLKAFGTLLAHITGFAGIRCFGILQLGGKFSYNCWTTMLVFPIFAAVAFLLVFLSQYARWKIVSTKDGDGGEKATKQEKEWLEQCAETEDDIISLTFSAMICTTCRYIITGIVPSAHGSMHGRDLHQVILLFAAGVACLAIVITLTWQKQKSKTSKEAHEHSREIVERVISCATVTSGLSMSWCFYFATQWGFFVFLRDRESFQGVAGKLIMAVLVSFITVLAIFILDCVGDGSEDWKKALKGVIIALGLLVGISWEGAFAMGVDEIAVNWHTPAQVLLVKTLLALSLVAVVLPAWRLYILPKADPAIMKYYNGRLPPLKALCTGWDPVKDDHKPKSERFRMLRLTRESS